MVKFGNYIHLKFFYKSKQNHLLSVRKRRNRAHPWTTLSVVGYFCAD
jgi:hypothetical protein